MIVKYTSDIEYLPSGKIIKIFNERGTMLCKRLIVFCCEIEQSTNAKSIIEQLLHPRDIKILEYVVGAQDFSRFADFR